MHTAGRAAVLGQEMHALLVADERHGPVPYILSVQSYESGSRP